MKRVATVFAILLFCTACQSTGELGKTTATPPSSVVADTGLTCSTTPGPPLAKFEPGAQRDCVWLHRNRDRRARVFSDPKMFSNVCPIVLENFGKDEGCLNRQQLPDIQAGYRMHLDYFGDTYQLSIVGPAGAVVSNVKLTAPPIKLGSGSREVSGYAWLQGADGKLVYYVYMDDPRSATMPADTFRHYYVEIYVDGDQNCRDDAPEKSAAANKDCEVEAAPAGRPPVSQGGTSPGGEPPPNRQ